MRCSRLLPVRHAPSHWLHPGACHAPLPLSPAPSPSLSQPCIQALLLGEFSLLRGPDPILAASIPRLLLLDCSPFCVFLPPETPQKNPKILKLSSFSRVLPPFQALHTPPPAVTDQAPGFTRPTLWFQKPILFPQQTVQGRGEAPFVLSQDPCTRLPFHLPPEPSALTGSS